MDENKFLANRQQRDAERKAKTDEDEAAEAAARRQFGADMAEFTAAVAQLLEAGGSPDEAMSLWRSTQAKVTDAVQCLGLTAYDIRAANAALAQAFNRIELSRAASAGGSERKFRFSRKVRPAGTSFRDSTGAAAAAAADVLGAQADRCSSDAADGKENAIVDVSNETRTFVRPLSAAFVRRCEQAVLLFAPINGSCFVSDCKGCRVYVACHQLRINRCVDCEFYVWCRSIPVIEQSTRLKFGSYDAWTGALEAIRSAGGPLAEVESVEARARECGIEDMEHARKAHRNVDDFGWIKLHASPNWHVLNENEYHHPPST